MRATIAAFLLLLLPLVGAGCKEHRSPTDPGGPVPLPAIGAVLSGRTLDAAGSPVGGVTVTIGSNGTVASATSNGEGFFALEPVPPGTYGVSIRERDSGTERAAGTVRLLPGLNVHDVFVNRCIVPYGVVRDAATGRAVAGAKVSIHFRQTTTDANGRYAIDFGCEAVPGSTITLRAEHPEYEPSETLSRASTLCSCAYDFLLTHR